MVIQKKGPAFTLDFQWQTLNPFLFCVHHLDHYPEAFALEGPRAFGPPPDELVGRHIGQDFQPRDGWRMYHGRTVPGFPAHPHRGFETITIVRRGYVDHADSMGAAGRYGEGDVQWMTAGAGVQHSEMFPLLKEDHPNTVELFQIWLNLPRARKFAKPHFTMLWNEQLPRWNTPDGLASLTIICGSPEGVATPPAPPPDSWASDPASATRIWLIKIQKGGSVTLPKDPDGTFRTIYVFGENSVSVSGAEAIGPKRGQTYHASSELSLTASQGDTEVLLLQSRPIEETVVQYGPFVMNSQAEIRQAISDYQQTQFGGWTWEREDMVHGPEIERFALDPEGVRKTPKD